MQDLRYCAFCNFFLGVTRYLVHWCSVVAFYENVNYSDKKTSLIFAPSVSNKRIQPKIMQDSCICFKTCLGLLTFGTVKEILDPPFGLVVRVPGC
jgi:hypothetical protein